MAANRTIFGESNEPTFIANGQETTEKYEIDKLTAMAANRTIFGESNEPTFIANGQETTEKYEIDKLSDYFAPVFAYHFYILPYKAAMAANRTIFGESNEPTFIANGQETTEKYEIDKLSDYFAPVFAYHFYILPYKAAMAANRTIFGESNEPTFIANGQETTEKYEIDKLSDYFAPVFAYHFYILPYKAAMAAIEQSSASRMSLLSSQTDKKPPRNMRSTN
ncbi:hypothetical protein BX666DRAFT_2033889 [Dichotomocladium elegans]|nr:hypothetical protein BX666DRAFT_2033889 [Dichotomocladium elegans]